MNIAMILAGGVGTRVGMDIPKQFIKVNNKPILVYTIENFQNNKNIDAIEIVAHENWLQECTELVKEYRLDKVRWFTTGGDTFQASVINGMEHLKGKADDDDVILISFGVSPYTTDEIIDDSIRVCEKYGNAIAAEDMVLSTCIMDDEISSTQNIIRETLKGFSNPWTFKFGDLCETYATAEKQGILEKVEPHTTSVYFELGKRLYFSKTNRKNFKITTPEDLEIFEGLVLLEESKKKEGLKS